MTLARLIPLAAHVSLFLIVFALGLATRGGEATYLFRRPGLLARSITAMNVVIRTARYPGDLAAAVRRTVLALDASQPPHSIITMAELASRSTAREKFSVSNLEALSGLALLMAVVGLYGVLSYSVTERRREIGIRLALGASRRACCGSCSGRGCAWCGRASASESAAPWP